MFSIVNTPDINGLTGSGGQQVYVATNLWNITGLTTNNFYRFRVKSVCTTNATVNTPFGTWLTLQAASAEAEKVGGETSAVAASPADGFPPANSFNTFNLYPNPANEKVELVANGKATVEIADLLGRTVVKATEFENQTTLNLKHLALGSYVVKITNEQGEVVSRKLVIE